MQHRSTETAIRVLVAADSEVARAGLEALVEASPALDLADTGRGVADLASLSEQVRSLDPDVLLVHLDGLDGESLTATVADLVPESSSRTASAPALVILAGDLGRDGIAGALRGGARAVLLAAASAAEIVAAVEAAASGLVVVHAEFVESLLSNAGSRPAPDGRTGRNVAGRAELEGQGRTLTPREVEILNLLAQGLGNKEIAWRLHISEHTVKFHISSVFTKLDVSGRTEAVTTGLRLGLIML